MGKKITRELHWFLTTMQEEFGLWVDATAISMEAVELGIDEVEDFFVPKEILKDLPPTLLYELMIHDDELYNNWVGAIAFHPDSPEWCLQVITQNEKLVFRKIFSIAADDPLDI